MKCIVTGGAGFVGAHLARRLIENGHEVIAYDDLSVGRRENVPAGAAFIKGDILDIGLLRKTMSGTDIVFHNAAFVSIRNSFFEPRRESEINVTGTLNVLDTMVEAGVPKIIFASSMAVYGIAQNDCVLEDDLLQPVSPYGLSKLKGEMLCSIYAERYGIKYSVLRYFNIFGKGQQYSEYVGVLTAFIKLAKSGKPITVCGDGLQERDFVYVDDVANANVLAMKNMKNRNYNIGSGKRTSILALAQAVQNIYKSVEIVYVPKPPGEIQTICADIRAASNDLKFSPTQDVLGYIPQLCAVDD